VSGRLWLALLLAASLHVGQGQGSDRLAEVEVGFRGAPVADAWNPLRVTVRDVGSGRLTLVADQGNLRDGEIPWTMVVPVTGGAGVRVLEVDVFLPAWRSLVWSLEAGGSIVASGALPREAAERSLSSKSLSHPFDTYSAIPSFSQRGQLLFVRKWTTTWAYSCVRIRLNCSRAAALSSPPTGTRILPS